MPRNAMPSFIDLMDAPAPDAPLAHDPGGKVETPLPKGMMGAADFYGANDEYRPWLTRLWDGAIMDSKCVLWIGMNPSTARADVNDPTITREVGFTKAWGYSAYAKCNVMDYRATSPKDLLAAFVVPRSDRNIGTILRFAGFADKIIMCHGVLHRKLQPYADDTLAQLRGAGHADKIYCLGRTLLGKPRHPLYLASDTKPERYP